VVIDMPQTIEFATNAEAPDLLHRDLVNVAAWFGPRGVWVDVEATFVELLALAW
jgi:serine/threonine-protein kinase RIO1